MITDNGVELVSKYLAGQASSYASHVAIGCGSRPLLNGVTTSFATGATISGVSASGSGYIATVTLSNQTLSYIEVGDVVTSLTIPPNIGSLGTGTVTVTAITGPKTFTVYSTGAITTGSVNELSVVTSIASKTFGSKTHLNFEMARYPITSRSYVVEQSLVTSSGLVIVGDYSIRLTVASHNFTTGDTIYVTNADTSTGPGTVSAPIEVNGLYKITSTTSTTITAIRVDTTIVGLAPWDVSLWNTTAMVGFSYNSYLINVTAYTKQISLTAEMTDIYQYDIAELGLYSLGSNQYTNSDSRILLNFTSKEEWQYATYNGTTFAFTDVSPSNVGATITSSFFTSSNDAYWISSSSKILSQQKPRYLSEGLVLPGNGSEWSVGTTFTSVSNYALLSSPGINLSNASSSDKILLAFSIVDAVLLPSAVPTDYYIMLQFTSSNGVDFARLLYTDADANNVPVPANRYVVLSKQISDIITTSGFDWKDVASVEVYASMEVSGTPTSDFAFVLDGLRYENVSTANPLYALTAYSVVNNNSGSKISKQANSNDMINFRLDLAVGL